MSTKVHTVAVLRGGPSEEYSVSMQTGAGVLSTLANTKYKSKDIIITRAGEWLVGGYQKAPQDALADVDVVFIALHGAYGEDGTVQRLLERLGIPYTGSGPYASALAMNKAIAKDHLKDLGIKMPHHMRVTRDGVRDAFQTAESIANMFGPQYVVKPVSGGSSIGTALAENPQMLGKVLAETLPNHPDLIVEERINGREATVGILENYRNQTRYKMPVIEIIPPRESQFFAADVKYSGATEEICPGRFTRAEKAMLEEAAEIVHKTLGLRHYSRSDFMVGSDGVYFLEVNTLPGFTSESLYPKAMAAVGGTFQELIEHLITQAARK